MIIILVFDSGMFKSV